MLVSSSVVYLLMSRPALQPLLRLFLLLLYGSVGAVYTAAGSCFHWMLYYSQRIPATYNPAAD